MPDVAPPTDVLGHRTKIERLEAALDRLEQELNSTTLDPVRVPALIALVQGHAALVSTIPRVRR